MEEQVIINNKVKTSREHRELVETFYGCPAGYLSEFVSWNDIMSVIEKIEDVYYNGFSINVNISKSGAYIGINPNNAGAEKFVGQKEIANTLNCNYFIIYPEPEITKIEAVWDAIIIFVNWYNINITND